MLVSTTNTPKRPFGLTLAILATVLFYVVLPLAAVGTILYLENALISGIEGGFIGIDFSIALTALAVPVVMALLLCVIAWLTWRGVRWMRFVFPIIVVGYTLLLLLGYLLPVLTTQPDPSRGIDSATQYQDSIATGYIFAISLLALYVAWFSQRWSSRAFFRGYYTDADIQRIAASYPDWQTNRRNALEH